MNMRELDQVVEVGLRTCSCVCVCACVCPVVELKIWESVAKLQGLRTISMSFSPPVPFHIYIYLFILESILIL